MITMEYFENYPSVYSLQTQRLNVTDSLKETPKILAGIGAGYRKIGRERTKSAVSLKWGKIKRKLLY